MNSTPKKRQPVCNHCGSSNISFDSISEWNIEKQRFETLVVYDQDSWCIDCEGGTNNISWCDVPTTKVVFRKFEEGDVIALFPEVPWSDQLISSYQHIGQHGGSSPELIEGLQVATEDEYSALLTELASLGYSDLEVVESNSAE